MEKFMNWLSESFTPKANNLFSKPWIAGLSSCMQKCIPFILTGSVIYVYNVFYSFFPVLPDISTIASYSFGLLSLIMVFMVTNQLLEKLNHLKYATNAGIIAIGILVLVATPIGEDADSLSAFIGNIGPSGVLVAIVVGYYVAIIFNLWAKLHFLEDSSIPDFVVNWINFIIPNLISLGIVMILVVYLNLNVYNLINVIFSPVVSAVSTLSGFVIWSFLIGFFYTLGVSTWLWSGLAYAAFAINIQANVDAVAAGLQATNIVTSESVFTLAFITMGGACCTLGLNVLMLFSKSKQLKMFGRVFIFPSIFNINEPIMFGAPVVFNPVLMIPAWINSIVGPIYVWVLMSTGLLNIPSAVIQVGQIPAPICSVMVTQDIRAVLWWAILFVIYLVIWFPLFKVFEKQKFEEEQKAIEA